MCSNNKKKKDKNEESFDFYKKEIKRGSCNVAIEILKTLTIVE